MGDMTGAGVGVLFGRPTEVFRDLEGAIHIFSNQDNILIIDARYGQKLSSNVTIPPITVDKALKVSLTAP